MPILQLLLLAAPDINVAADGNRALRETLRGRGGGGRAFHLVCHVDEVRWALRPGSDLVRGLLGCLSSEREGFEFLPASMLNIAMRDLIMRAGDARRCAEGHVRELFSVRSLAAAAWARRRAVVCARAIELSSEDGASVSDA